MFKKLLSFFSQNTQPPQSGRFDAAADFEDRLPMTDITTKIKIVDSFYSVARKSIDIKPEIMKGKDVDEFFEYNDLGVPLAVAIVKGTAEPTELGKDVINETYSLLCKLLKVDETLTMNYVEHFWYYVNGEVWEDDHSNNPYRNYDNEFG